MKRVGGDGMADLIVYDCVAVTINITHPVSADRALPSRCAGKAEQISISSISLRDMVKLC